jgi:hypothetical protein
LKDFQSNLKSPLQQPVGKTFEKFITLIFSGLRIEYFDDWEDFSKVSPGVERKTCRGVYVNVQPLRGRTLEKFAWACA